MSVTHSRTVLNAAAACWSCRAAGNGEPFCPACGKIQPIAAGGSYFALFRLPEKLNLDSASLEAQFHKLSWKLHPDNFVRASELEQKLSLERSSELNDAFRTLREPVSRVEYLLAREGMRKEGTAKQQAPPELLEEVFELNESLDELRDARQSGDDLEALRGRLEAAQQSFQEKLCGVDAELRNVFAEWDRAIDVSADEAARKAAMSKMNEILNRRSYIRNLVANVQQELAAPEPD